MANKKQKLELTWIGKDEELHLEPRILIEDPSKSYGDPKSENMLIHGDNLLALKALEQDFAGRVKCIYIDPPYNTGTAFEQYDDNLEHSIWLNLISPRLQLLWKLLENNEGSIWISIDDSEFAYMKVLCDEIFQRTNHIATCVWQKRYSRENREAIGDVHEYVLVYAKNPSKFKEHRNLVPFTEEQASVYKNPNNDPKGRWRSIPMTAQAGHATAEQFYEIISPSGKIHKPSQGRCWAVSKNTFEKLLAEGRIWFGKDGNAQPNMIRYLAEVEGVAPWTWWPNEEVGHTDEAKKEMHTLLGKVNAFDTPKPERLIHRILAIATNPGDLVMDSFLGSGTTSAVAHKMGRKYIGIEFGEHANTHCLSRLRKVIDGTDGLKLSKELEWNGGGGFKFYNLAPSLLRKDTFGNFVIDPSYNANMLAAAVCKHDGFKFYPDEIFYWKQGNSTETDFIFVTTSFITVEQLDKIQSEMKPDESLLVCAKSYAPECEGRFANITIKKIPQMILGTCEFGKDNYDLNIIKTTQAQAEESNAASL